MIAEQTMYTDTISTSSGDITGKTMEDESRWQAVISRDARQDGSFVFAVSSTGIYCKPSCPSRRPRREHVSFFAAPGDAEEAGFRACKRCRPDGLDDVTNRETVQTICRYIEENYSGERPITLAALGDHVGLSPFHLQRVFKKATGITPRQYAGLCAWVG